MVTILLAALVLITRLLGLYVGVLILCLVGAFAIAGVYALIETTWRWTVRRLRHWRVAQDLAREREYRVRSMALTGTQDLPPTGGPRRVV